FRARAPGYTSTPRLRATSAGSLLVSTVPNGVSTRALPSFSWTRTLWAIFQAMKPAVPAPIIPRTTITPTIIRITLTALLPCAGATGGAAGTGVAVITGVAEAGCADPHLAQNFAPAASICPQELQKAITVSSKE